MTPAGRNPAPRASGRAARAAASEHVSPAERAARGKSLRKATPRSSHASWEPRPDRPDPISLLEEQAADRVPELAPIRYGRMSASPFAFYRGAAYIMASDLAGSPQTGIRVQVCGDAHLSNFGAFASPERHLLFDLNDFDETLPGPWEWDLKRLAASVAVAGRENAVKTKRRTAIVRELVGEYRRAIRRFAAMKTLDVWYAGASVSDLRRLLRSTTGADRGKQLDRTIAKGRRKDSSRAFAKLAVLRDEEARIRPEPPLIVPIADLADRRGASRLELSAHKLLESYLASLPRDRRRLLERYRYVDLARKVVGVGSVGTRCWVILLLGRDSSDPLFLQAKEASRSVLERFVGKSEFANHGQRVVEGQRLMQSAGDIFSDGCASRLVSKTSSRAICTCVSCGTRRSQPTSPRCGRPTWPSTPGCARGRWPAPTLDPATRPRSPATSVPRRSSTVGSRSSPRPTPIRPSATTPRSSTRSQLGV